MTLPINYADVTPPTGALTALPATGPRGINTINGQINRNTTAIGINVADPAYGAVSGASDNSTAVAAAISAAVAARTGYPSGSYTHSVVFFPPGTWLFGAQTLPEGVYIDGQNARLRPTAGLTGNWITIDGQYSGIGLGVCLVGNNVNGEVAVKITTNGYHSMVSSSFTNWGGKCIRDEGTGTHIDSPFIGGMKNTTYVNALTAGSYVGVVELAGTDAWLGKCEITGEQVIAMTAHPSTNKVVAAVYVPGGNNMVDGPVLEQADIGVYNTGFYNKYKNARAEFCGTHGFWMAAGSGQILGCQAMGNGRVADNTYDGFHIDNQDWFFANNISTSDIPGDSIKHRYGLYNNSSVLTLGKFRSSSTDHNAYRDAVNSVTYATDENIGSWVAVPATATSPGKYGQKAADTSYEYTCIATNTWRRVAIATW